MRVIRGLGSRIRRPLCLAMGVLDGVHEGHRAIIAAAVRMAARTRSVPAVLTFDPHPDAVLSPDGAPPLLTTTDEKLALLRGLGIRTTVVTGFDRELADTPAERFVQELLVGRLRARCLVVGEDCRFGHRGRGRPALLRRMALRLGFGVHVVRPVIAGGANISSTRIRRLLTRGRVSAAEKLLGRRYQVAGKVVPGAGVGRELGHPTANLRVEPGKLVPGDGIYACLAGQRRLRPAVAYIGRRPTIVSDGERQVEVHLLDGGGRVRGAVRRAAHQRVDLLGRVVRIEFVERVRGDREFPSREALAKQMARDCARARRLLAPAGRAPSGG